MTTPDLSRRSGGAAEADRLDAAIDHVAARMVTVADDGELTLRIVSALPGRASRLRWVIPQLTAIGAIVVAALVWTARDNNTAPAVETLPSATVAQMSGLPNAVAADQPGTASRTLPVEPSRRPVPVEPAAIKGVDHERALSPIEAVSALVVNGLAPRELPDTPALELAPIALADLPLTAESFPPR